jgi:site-specific DNA recombinase
MKKREQPPIKKPVGIWIRVSTENQARGDSPQHHEKRAQYYAESRDWQVAEVYRLEAVSGKSVMEHPETQRMLKDIRAGRVGGLIFSKLARLARNTKELLEFADIFQECGADLISLQESIDTSTPAGRLFYTMIAAMAQWEREEIADRVRASMVVRAKLGKSLGGHAPFGYAWKNNKLVPDAKEAPIRKLMYELFLEHRRKKAVARLLNDAGYRTRNGSRFSDTTVTRLLTDPTAKGMRRANYTKLRSRGKGWDMRPEDEWIWSSVEPIVSEETWNECNEILTNRTAKRKPLGRRPVHLFAGATYCHCGNKMYVPSNTPKYVCYSCRNKVPVVDLEAIYYEQLKGFFLSPDEIASQMHKADENIAKKEELARVLRQEQENVEREIQRIYRLYADGGLTADGFGKFYRPLEERQKQLDEEVPRLQAEVDVLKIGHLSTDKILSKAKDLYGRWPHLNRDEKQRIVESITEKIIIGKDDISINLCYLPSSEELTKWQRNLSGSSLRST